MSNQPITVFVLPAKNKNNKYVDLFVDSLWEADHRVTVVGLKKDRLIGIFRHLVFGKGSHGLRIVHIHWSTTLYGSRFALKSLLSMVFNYLILLKLKYLWQVKIVWTIHNVEAHDYKHPWIDRLGRWWLAKVVDCFIVQQESTLATYQQRHPTKKVVYIPHGNYVDAYGPLAPRDKLLRRSFGFADDDIVLLSFGALAPYKLNEKIISAVVNARKDNPSLKLLIAGKGKSEYVESLKLLAGDDSGVVIDNKFIDDDFVSHYLSIADYAVFYYDQTELTSGGMILALSYGVPVITRAIAAAELVTEKTGCVYQDEAGLEAILSGLKRPFKTVAVRAIVDSVTPLAWPEQAKLLLAMYRNL